MASVDDEIVPTDPAVLAEYIAALPEDQLAIGLELEALESIYPSSLSLTSPLRYTITIPAWEDEEDAPRISLLVSLPETYPSKPPLFQLLGRYVGNFPIDAGLFGSITRTFISSAGVPFTPGEVCVFDGLVYVQGVVLQWHSERVLEAEELEAARTAERGSGVQTPERENENPQNVQNGPKTDLPATLAKLSLSTQPTTLPDITSSTPIVDRKSSFVGHAARITDINQVSAVVSHLLTDKKIARAAHPTIWAYRLIRDVGGAAGSIVESDYDDDGETQAGSRLKHLLEILEVDNVVVVVSRWFGGIHLGPDRFKHINQAARDALEGAGLLEDVVPKKKRR